MNKKFILGAMLLCLTIAQPVTINPSIDAQKNKCHLKMAKKYTKLYGSNIRKNKNNYILGYKFEKNEKNFT